MLLGTAYAAFIYKTCCAYIDFIFISSQKIEGMTIVSAKSLSTMLPQITFALEEHVRSTNGLAKPMEIIGVGMQFIERYSHLTGAEKKELFIKALEYIANGKDGVAGTDDDVIPKKTVDTIKMLLDNGIVEQTIDLVSDIAKGKYDINKTITSIVEVTQKTGCFGFLARK